MAEELRDEPRFDPWAEQRQRRRFIALAIACAGLAIAGGVSLALWLSEPPTEQKPPPLSNPQEAQGETPAARPILVPFDDFEETPAAPSSPAPRPRKAPTLKRELERADIARGFGQIRGSLTACAQKHGAIDGTLVTVAFRAGPDGSAHDARVQAPHSRTPLGRCVASAVEREARFRRTREGLENARHSVKLRRSS